MLSISFNTEPPAGSNAVITGAWLLSVTAVTVASELVKRRSNWAPGVIWEEGEVMDTMEFEEFENYLCTAYNNLEIMTEMGNVKKRIYSASREVGNNLVLVDRNMLCDLIAEIEDKLDELEAITYPDFMKEICLRVNDIESGEVTALDEDKIFDLLKG